jgi:hypothetical protein
MAKIQTEKDWMTGKKKEKHLKERKKSDQGPKEPKNNRNDKPFAYSKAALRSSLKS